MAEFFEELCFDEHQLYYEEQTWESFHHFSEEDHEISQSEDNINNSQEEAGYEGDDDAEENGAGQVYGRQSREMTVQEKRQLVDEVMLNMEGDSVPRGFISKLARKHHVHRSTTTRWFQVIKQHILEGHALDVRTKKLGTIGRKLTEYTDEFLTYVPLYKKQTERGYAAALHISKAALHRLRQRGRLRTHTSTNKPALTDNHKIARLKWVLSHIHPIPSLGDPTFVDMQQRIHIDEKWFFINPETRTFYLLPTEENPYRAQQSRRFKVKALFMGMIGKPLYDENKQLLHDGKYGLFPFVKYEATKKKSKNRDKGTIEAKAVQSINKEAIRDMLLNHVIPTLHEQWPSQLPKNITIQWDNARPHQVPQDAEFQEATQAYGFNIQFVFQPAQSPDMNALDLGLFNVIQSIQYQSFPQNVDDLIKEVDIAFQQFEPELNKYSWLTLQSCMVEVPKRRGGNNYITPHMKKRSLDRQGILPDLLEVDKGLIGEVVTYLDSITIPVNGEDEGHMEVDAD
ncbi:uncharacterized protein LOC110715117 [Chenopodium quinoa]|uniref:uncharacterized protein LOC110715117 n=1 Tax=Chenopodium quinoa TaxID=63459 RepID=UPI000B78D3C1|nr:uncharacterized protein LOC110715117 [Chenopodium quinoa]